MRILKCPLTCGRPCIGNEYVHVASGDDTWELGTIDYRRD